jgi:thiamine pyrophosphokinase
MTACIVVLGGLPPDTRIRRHLAPEAFVIGADQGFNYATDLGLRLGLAVGDFDSIGTQGRQLLADSGIACEVSRPDKDESDGVLALRAALVRHHDRITVVSGGGMDRLDHLVIAVAMLTDPALANVEVDGWFGPTYVAVVRPARARSWPATEGETVTLLAVGGSATGVRTTGLAWPLTGETLAPSSSRGLSNTVKDPDPEASSATVNITISVDKGLLLVLRPDRLEPSRI